MVFDTKNGLENFPTSKKRNYEVFQGFVEWPEIPGLRPEPTSRPAFTCARAEQAVFLGSHPTDGLSHL